MFHSYDKINKLLGTHSFLKYLSEFWKTLSSKRYLWGHVSEILINFSKNFCFWECFIYSMKLINCLEFTVFYHQTWREFGWLCKENLIESSSFVEDWKDFGQDIFVPNASDWKRSVPIFGVQNYVGAIVRTQVTDFIKGNCLQFKKNGQNLFVRNFPVRNIWISM